MIKVDNAIILAAGRGSRLKHLTAETPKPLLAPKDIPFIEDIILKLKEKNINEIFVVVGYLGDKFKYLEKKFGIKIIKNTEWDKGNNVTSIVAAKDYLKNTLILNGDIILKGNPIKNEYESSLTYVEENFNIDEWIVKLNDKGNVVDFEKDGLGKAGLYQREIIFITKPLVEAMKQNLKSFDMQEYQEYLMIESAKQAKIDFKTFKVQKRTIFDLDTVEEFEEYTNSK
ncbi:sugar phosphate nucleotidyltransferase [Mycoplasma todarodis]|uniref:sugar phosphate nucleotidyltransferase n=1 Tax=Mycoplasma todarodis TaxID=1937191 RepID=UPI003B3357ED